MSFEAGIDAAGLERRPGIATLWCSTYNIRRALGTDGHRSLDRIAEVVESLDSDVVALQEIDSEVDAHGFEDQLAYLAKRTGMTPVAGPAFRRGHGGYGNALLTRLPVSAFRKHDLSVTAREPRSVLEVTVELGGGSLSCVTTHLGLREGERARQVRALLGILDSAGPAPVVLMGDFNAWSPISRVCRTLDRALGAAPARRSYPSRMPIVALDRIWVRHPARLTDVRAVRTPLTRRASDHLPVRARIEIVANRHGAESERADSFRRGVDARSRTRRRMGRRANSGLAVPRVRDSRDLESAPSRRRSRGRTVSVSS